MFALQEITPVSPPPPPPLPPAARKASRRTRCAQAVRIGGDSAPCRRRSDPAGPEEAPGREEAVGADGAAVPYCAPYSASRAAFARNAAMNAPNLDEGEARYWRAVLARNVCARYSRAVLARYVRALFSRAIR